MGNVTSSTCKGLRIFLSRQTNTSELGSTGQGESNRGTWPGPGWLEPGSRAWPPIASKGAFARVALGSSACPLGPGQESPV